MAAEVLADDQDVTPEGCEVLSAGIPSARRDVEEWIREAAREER